MKKILFIALATTAAFAATAAQADTTNYNSAPAVGWHYGSGNDYSPANTAVLTTDAGDQLYLRWHKRSVVAPASVGDTYSFALGTQPLSFDWGYSGTSPTVTSMITVKNIGTGQSVTFDPAIWQSDSTIVSGNTQNSAHLGFAFLSGVGFNAGVDDVYRVTLDVNGLSGGPHSFSVDAKLGAGVPEPATWAMMLGGFGLLGGAVRRRRQTPLVTA